MRFENRFELLERTAAVSAEGRVGPGESTGEGWGPPETDEPEPGEMPARVCDHLTWLKEAGFKDVDCFWMRGGIAIYGGYR